jgi:NTE family protein
MSRTLVLGGGGLTGIAWEAGMLAGLEDAGVDITAFDRVIGTSAGAYVGACLLRDGSARRVFAAQRAFDPARETPPLRACTGRLAMLLAGASSRERLAWLQRAGVVPLALRALAIAVAIDGPGVIRVFPVIARSRRQGTPPKAVARALGRLAVGCRTPESRWVGYWARGLGREARWPDERLAVTAVDAADGSRIVIDRSTGVSLARAVAASTAISGILPAIDVGGRRCIDGGTGSPTNADLAIGADEVVLLAPADRGALDQEIARLEVAGAVVTLIRPSAVATEAMGEDLGRLDPSRVARSAEAGLADGTSVSGDSRASVRGGPASRPRRTPGARP